MATATATSEYLTLTSKDNVDAANVVKDDANGTEMKNDEFMDMYVFVYINKIDDVKLNEETFYADFDLALVWPCEVDPSIKREDLVLDIEDDSLKFLKQTISFPNAIEEKIDFLKQSYQYRGAIDMYGEIEDGMDEDKCCKLVSYKFNGKFKQRFQLHNFPFDIQNLLITIGAVSHCSHLIFSGKLPSPYWEAKLDMFGADLDEYVIQGFKQLIFQDSLGYDRIQFQIKVKRKFSVYFWKVGIYMFMLTISSVVIFCLHSNDYEEFNDNIYDKLSLILTLLLTGVALQFAIGTWIPNLSYLTLLDKYILFSFLIMFALMIIIVFVTMIDENDSDLVNLISIIVFIAFIVSQIICVGYMYYKRNEEIKDNAKEGKNAEALAPLLAQITDTKEANTQSS